MNSRFYQELFAPHLTSISLHDVYTHFKRLLPMLIMPIAVFSALLLLWFAELQPKPPKPPEKELGDAIAKYLKGLKDKG